jgi:hypothetical protein
VTRFLDFLLLISSKSVFLEPVVFHLEMQLHRHDRITILHANKSFPACIVIRDASVVIRPHPVVECRLDFLFIISSKSVFLELVIVFRVDMQPHRHHRIMIPHSDKSFPASVVIRPHPVVERCLDFLLLISLKSVFLDLVVVFRSDMQPHRHDRITILHSNESSPASVVVRPHPVVKRRGP